jgi:radical SAM protein with 4Fe4S-binding SPASM domain
VESLGYGEFSSTIHNRLAGQRAPLNGTIEVTHRCPLRCAHCYNNLPQQDRAARSRELSRAEHCRILEEIADAGCLWLLYTGGEMFVRPDFLDIYMHAKKKGLLVSLFTNATLITSAIADRLAEWPPFSIEVTLYGRTRETYEGVTGVSGSFERCLRGIRLLRERALPLKLKSVAMTLNRHEIGDLQRFVEQDLGLEFKFDAMLNPRIDALSGPLAVRMSPDEVVGLDLADSRRCAAWKEFACRYDGPVHGADNAGRMFHCGGGINAFAIDPHGMMTLCVLSRSGSYDLRNGSFSAGWEHLGNVRSTPARRETKCTACALKAMCGMCPANAELESRDPEAPVDFLCRVAHLRAYALDLPVAPHGTCDYCEGGPGHRQMIDTAVRLRERFTNTLTRPKPGTGPDCRAPGVTH